MIISRVIDHTLLAPDAGYASIVKLCEEALTHDFHSVCLHPPFIKKATAYLKGTDVQVSTVIGFPFGAHLSHVKIYEAMEAVTQGAAELDIVIHIGAVKSGEWKLVSRELEGIITATPDAVHKIIIETCYLDDEEIKRMCEIVIDSGAEYIKTSTGYGPGGARIKDVTMLKSIAGNKIGIKAAGGIKTLNELMAFINAGATRIGTSHGLRIIKELDEQQRS
ncbi:MAG: deoxyribose-phosphate aldolase [Nitrospiraceae bacterium]|nr:MAG: deoxyribose-phosphate aldolase [Nitrospiraceae bacterium]